MRPERHRLARTRRLINLIDDGMLALLAARGRLAAVAARDKHAAGLPLRDPGREAQVHLRAAALARLLGISPHSARELLAVAIADACRRQRIGHDFDQGGPSAAAGNIAPRMNAFKPETASHPWLGRLPPPARWAPLLRVLPRNWQWRALELALQQVLGASLQQGRLEFLRDRCLGIEVTDLGLNWVFTLEATRLQVVGRPAEASVRGSLTDLLLLASRLEDADTLFFQRRLVLTGDTELGLTARNLLDALPWDQVPLALRIVLNRGARFAEQARSAHRAGIRARLSSSVPIDR